VVGRFPHTGCRRVVCDLALVPFETLRGHSRPCFWSINWCLPFQVIESILVFHMRTSILAEACCFVGLCSLLSLPAFGQVKAPVPQAKLESIRISKDGRHFVTAGSGRRFTPWGCNYDHDRSGRLLEQYWDTEWDTVAQNFAEMKTLGANTVRIHLQVAHFMKSAREPNQESLQRLSQLVSVAERTGLYLTGFRERPFLSQARRIHRPVVRSPWSGFCKALP